MHIRLLVLSLLVAAVPLLPAQADDVTSQINEALSAYGRKDIPTAIAGLEAALNLLRQGRADLYGALLPAAPAGWTAEQVETVSVGAAVVGGGVGHRGNTTRAAPP
jgi:hypothetical protein